LLFKIDVKEKLMIRIPAKVEKSDVVALPVPKKEGKVAVKKVPHSIKKRSASAGNHRSGQASKV
jgi:hypothetical protein